jgi:hypothetical protein
VPSHDTTCTSTFAIVCTLRPARNFW